MRPDLASVAPNLTRGPSETAAVVVIKIGGSVLVDLPAYHRAASFLARRRREAPTEKVVAVVSAENGLTDSLLRQAKEITAQPDPAALDLLWSTGEVHSVALLVLCLHARGLPAVGLSVHETGLVLPDGSNDPAHVELDRRRLLDALARYPVVVVPGFLACRPTGAIVSLGRGGSDLTAVLLSAKLRARRCELIKDVPGYFDKDPNRNRGARHLSRLSFDTALVLADAGCDLVQRQAVEAAGRFALPLVIRTLDQCAPHSLVTSAHAVQQPEPQVRISGPEDRACSPQEFVVPAFLRKTR